MNAEEIIIRNEDIPRIHSPIGLDIGAETPDEIAVSIIGEIQSKFANRSGGFLKYRSAPIHERDPQSGQLFKQIYVSDADHIQPNRLDRKNLHYVIVSIRNLNNGFSMKSTHPLDNENYEDAVGIILLAAGSSSRMGQSKQLLLIGGESLLAHSLKISLATALKNVVVVLGVNREDHRSVVKNFKVDVVINDQWARGMGSSIKCGLRHLLIHKQVNAVIVMVCDQPLLQPTHLQKLISKHIESKSPIVASAYADTVGVPVLFGKAIFEELLELKDSEGAKKILLRHKAISIPFPEGIIDLDHIDDYHDFIKTHKMD